MSNDIEAGHPLVSESEQKYLYGASKTIRENFARKVYGVLATQLTATFLISGFLATRQLPWLLQNSWLLYSSMLGSMVMIIGLSFFPNVARKVPTNYTFLAVFTILESVLVGFFAGMYDLPSVLIAVGATAGIFVALTVFAIFTKLDLTGLLPYLVSFTFALIFFGLVAILFPASRGVQLLYGFAGSALFSMYIVVDTQMIFKGDREALINYTVDDYIFAALAVYLDVINLFINLLSIIGNRRD